MKKNIWSLCVAFSMVTSFAVAQENTSLDYLFEDEIIHSPEDPSSQTQPSDTVELPRSHSDTALGLGVQAYRSKNWSQAVFQLKKAMNESVDLEQHIRPLLTKSLIHTKQHIEAFSTLHLPAKSTTESDLEKLSLKIEAAIGARQLGEAQSLLTRFAREAALLKSHQDEVVYLQGLLAEQNGQGLSSWKKLLTLYADSARTKDVLKKLSEKGQSLNTVLSAEDWIKRANSFVDNSLASEAVPIFEKHGSPEDLARAVFKSRDYIRAAQLFEKLVAANEPSPSLDLLYKLSVSYGRSDQFEKAITAYKRVMKAAPLSSSATEARYKIPFIHFDAGQYDKAFKMFESYLQSKTKYKVDDAKTYYMWSAFLTKRYDIFIKQMDLSYGKSTQKLAMAYYNYWKGRALELKGDKNYRRYYEAAHSSLPTGYYGLLAKQRLRHGELIQNYLVKSDVLDFVPQGKPNWNWTDASHSPLSKASRLAKVGLFKEAYTESEKINLSGQDMATSASLYAQASNFRKVLSLGSVATKVAPPTSSASLYYSATFPQAYKELVVGFSRQWGLDPFIGWAIMREESVFKPFVESHAAAIGLMQIIPPTGLEIARAIGDTDFHPDDLKNPWVNIKYGTWYLSERWDQFGGVPYYTMASYNAGPDAVSRWKKWGDKLPPDVFIELIPYDETRAYVKKVLRSYWFYKKLYGH